MTEVGASAPPAAPLPPWDPSQDQAVALEKLFAWEAKARPSRQTAKSAAALASLFAVGGLAGTGKTRTLGFAVRVLVEQGLRVACATFTGKASLVLTASLNAAGAAPLYVGTIHRLLYVPRVNDDGEVIGWTKAATLEYDLIVIDEASMVPKETLADLRSYGVPLLCVGDHGQLPPVGEDVGVMANPDVRLEKIHRQATGNPIITIAAAVRQGATLAQIEKALELAPDPRVRFVHGRAGMVEALRFAGDPSSSMLIAYTNECRIGLNVAARRLRGVRETDCPPLKGESLICLRNVYRADGSLVPNGARGILQGDVQEMFGHWWDGEILLENGVLFMANMLKAQFNTTTFKKYSEIPGGPWYSWEDVGMLFDFGYALTCHKAQGSQADRVAVVVENKTKNMKGDEYKRWLYTAITRAQNELMINIRPET